MIKAGARIFCAAKEIRIGCSGFPPKKYSPQKGSVHRGFVRDARFLIFSAPRCTENLKTAEKRPELKLAAKPAALTAGFFDPYLHESYVHAGKLSFHLASDLLGDIFGQQFGTRVHER